MRRITRFTVLSFAALLFTTNSVQACCIPYIPWLDPFAWLGFYGCGGGCGNGCGGYGYGYQQPVYGGYAPQMSYPVAPAPGCHCSGAVAQPQYSALQLPVTTYQPMPQYVPQTAYRTQYQPPAVAGYPAAGYGGNFGQPTAPVYQPMAAYQSAPAATAYGTVPAATVYDTNPGSNVIPSNVYPSHTFLPPPIATPLPVGDVAGDHEYPTQSAVVPQYRQPYQAVNPIRPASYGVTPQPARTFSAAVR